MPGMPEGPTDRQLARYRLRIRGLTIFRHSKGTNTLQIFAVSYGPKSGPPKVARRKLAQVGKVSSEILFHIK